MITMLFVRILGLICLCVTYLASLNKQDDSVIVRVQIDLTLLVKICKEFNKHLSEAQENQLTVPAENLQFLLQWSVMDIEDK